MDPDFASVFIRVNLRSFFYGLRKCYRQGSIWTLRE